ncbi:MAG: urease accessory protein UreD [Hydrogenophaga sp.]
MTWQANLSLDYRLADGRTVLHHAHDGPLRILKSLYPEGDAICHNVIVHPPGGLVGGDTLDIRVKVGECAHGFIGTPGATRFYASDEALTTQRVRIELDAGARLEWLPLEAIAYPGCRARNHWQATLGQGAELLAWDITALGLPSAGQAFDSGRFEQRLSIPGLWLEQAQIDAADERLLSSPLGLGGHRCLGTLILASGDAFTRERREALLAVVREALAEAPDGVRVAATCPNSRMLVVRAVAPLVEPLMGCLQSVWRVLRPAAWDLAPQAPRIWRV